MKKTNNNKKNESTIHLEDVYDPKDNVKFILGNAIESMGKIPIHIDSEGNAFDTKGNYIPLAPIPEPVITPTKESYINQKIQNKRDEAVRKIMSTNVPTAVNGIQANVDDTMRVDKSLINKKKYNSSYDKEQTERLREYLKNNKTLGETCISTATTPYGQTVAYNPDLYNNPEKYGFKSIYTIEPTSVYASDSFDDYKTAVANNTFKNAKLSQIAKPGDLFQFIISSYISNKHHPFHSGMYLGLGKDDNGETMLKTKQSHGFYYPLDNVNYYLNDEDAITKPSDGVRVYRYIGTPAERKILSDRFDLLKQQWNK